MYKEKVSKMENFNEMEKVVNIHEHFPVKINGNDAVLALDTLPIPAENLQGQKCPYELMAFGTDDKGNIDYGNELMTERFTTAKEAVMRTKDVALKFANGYNLYEIPPQGHTFEIIKEETQRDGVKLSPYDVVMKDENNQNVLIAKTGKAVENQVEFDRMAYPMANTNSGDGFVKNVNESGKEMWKAKQLDPLFYPVDAMRKAAFVEYTNDKTKEVEATLTTTGKDFVAINKELTFLKSVGNEVVADTYEPVEGKKGVYEHLEKTYENDGLTKVINHGPKAMDWDTLEKRNQENFEKIAEAKQKKILHLPENVMHMMPNQLKELRNNPEMTIKPKREQAVVIGPKRPGSDKGMQM